mmetsp:Transcript_7898/g.19364  ORF Transcript_7898/g.19364 Transcript_7898/m.19364 type:complete len:349 (-) Transcript_7898:1934-2980(-)
MQGLTQKLRLLPPGGRYRKVPLTSPCVPLMKKRRMYRVMIKGSWARQRARDQCILVCCSKGLGGLEMLPGLATCKVGVRKAVWGRMVVLEGKMWRWWRPGVRRKSSGRSSGSSSSSSSAGPQQAEVLQFTKFFHLVPAQGLRRAYSQASSSPGQPPASWESLLMTLEAASNSPCSSNNSSSGQLQMHKAATTLLRTPRIFMLALVWESPQVAPDAIHGTLSALGPELDLLAAFKVPPKAAASSAAAAAPSHSLRAAVCYVGHHYLAFVLAEELGLWLCFDDADISLVGQWADVCRAMLNRRMQPLLLLYEDKASQQQQGPGAAAAAPAAAAPAAALPASHPAPVASRA